MTSFIISLAIRLTALLCIGGIAALAVRRSTSAVRHVVLAATLACVIALPAMMLLLPSWRVAMLPAAPPAEITTWRATVAPASAPRAAQAPSRAVESSHPVLITSDVGALPSTTRGSARAWNAFSARQLALAVWLLGVIAGLSWIALGRYGLARVRRRAAWLTTTEWCAILEDERANAGVSRHVTLLASSDVSTPVTWGIMKPVIVLPVAAHGWSHDRKRVVLMHELAHVARRDSATQLLAALACVAYWMHPLVLLAARKLRAECERACDERVLELGTPAADYASHLLEVARYARSFGASSIVSVAMARPSQLEGRVLAVLRSTAAGRRAATRRSKRGQLLTVAAAAVALSVVSAFTPAVREARSGTPRFYNGEITHGDTPSSENASVRAGAPSASPAPEPARAATTVIVESIAPTSAVANASAISLAQSADSTFKKSVDAREGGTLDLDLDTGGDIEITGTDDSRVSVSGSLGGANWRESSVRLEGENGDARLESRFESSPGNQSFDNSFTIRVPKKYNVRLHSAGGSVAIHGVEGSFTGTTGGGTIAIDHARGDAELTTGGGDIRVSDSHMDGSLTTGGGSTKMTNVTGGLTAQTGSARDFGAGFGRGFAPGYSESFSPGRKMRVRAYMPMRFRDSTMVLIPDSMMSRELAALDAQREVLERSREQIERARRMAEDAARSTPNAHELLKLDSTLQKMRVKLNDTTFARMRVYIADSVATQLQRAMEQMRVAVEVDHANMELNRRDMERLHDKGARSRSFRMESRTTDDGKHVILIDKDGGDIQLEDAPDGARVSTGGGSISVGRSHGDISAETGGGDIEIGPIEGSAEAITGKGDVSIDLVGEKPHPVEISSGSGDVQVILPKNANVTLDLETAYTNNYGKATKIRSDWPLNITQTDSWDDAHGTPRKYVRVKQDIGKGGPLIRVRTVNGDIKLKEGSK